MFSPTPPGNNASVTFVLHDAGETKALLPVMQRLEQSGTPYSILATSTARKLLGAHPRLAPLPQDVAEIARTRPDLLAIARQKLDAATRSACVVTGLISEFQEQWADWFAKSGRRVIGYYDGFNYEQGRNRAENFIGKLSAMITPSRDTAQFYQQRFFGIPVLALGQPTLETIAATVAQPTLRQQLTQQLQLNPTQRTLLFVGGGPPHYEEAFRVFCQTASQLQNVNLLLSLHPKADGVMEQQVLQEYGLTDRVRLVPRNITTDQVFSVADIVVSQDSTMNIPAVLLGKKGFFVGPAANRSDTVTFNPLTHYGLARRYESPDVLLPALQQVLQEPPGPPQAEAIQQFLGIPANASQSIANFLKAQLGALPLPTFFSGSQDKAA